jgi:hypothetical protein
VAFSSNKVAGDRGAGGTLEITPEWRNWQTPLVQRNSQLKMPNDGPRLHQLTLGRLHVAPRCNRRMTRLANPFRKIGLGCGQSMFWHILAHFSGHDLPQFASVYFCTKCEIANVYAEFC